MWQKAILVGVGMVIVVVVSFLLVFKNISYAEQFNGQIEEVKQNSIFASGFFVDSKTNKLAEDSNSIEILIGSDTKIIKTLLYMPTQKELKETGGKWNPGNLKKETKEVLVEELKSKKGFPIMVKMKKVRQGIQKFTAIEIDFTEQIYSD